MFEGAAGPEHHHPKDAKAPAVSGQTHRLSEELAGALTAQSNLPEAIVEDLKHQGVKIELLGSLGSGSFSDTVLVEIDGHRAAMKTLGGASGVHGGLLIDSLGCDLAQLARPEASLLKANPKYFGKVEALMPDGPKTVAYLKEYVEAEDCLSAICRGAITKDELLRAVKEIFAERIAADLYVWDMNPKDFLVRPEPKDGALVDRICLIDPCTPPLAASPGVVNDSLEYLIESFSSAVDRNIRKTP